MHDELVLERASEITEQIPLYIDLKEPIPQDSEDVQQLTLSPYWTLLSHEVAQWNSKLRTLATSLNQLVAAVKGETAMLQDTEAMYEAIANDKVPKMWQVSY